MCQPFFLVQYCSVHSIVHRLSKNVDIIMSVEKPIEFQLCLIMAIQMPQCI